MTDISVIKVDPVTGLVTFSFREMSRSVSGPEEALQLVAYHLLTTRGSNIFNRDEGGDLQDLKNSFIRGAAETKTEAAVRVSRALASIRDSQSDNKAANATVTGLRLLSATASGDKIEMSVRIDLLDGNSFSASFRV